MVQLTEEQKAEITGRVQKWLRRLNLGHWTIRVDEDELAPDNSVLAIESVRGRQLAYIKIGRYFDDDVSEAQRENAVCHELLHSMWRPLHDTFLIATDELSPQARKIADDQFLHILERTIDHLANVFVPVDGIRADEEAAGSADQEQGAVAGAACESGGGGASEGDA